MQKNPPDVLPELMVRKRMARNPVAVCQRPLKIQLGIKVLSFGSEIPLFIEIQILLASATGMWLGLRSANPPEALESHGLHRLHL